MSFPAAPTNGQVHTEGGSSFTYNLAANAWVRNAAAAGLQSYRHTQAAPATTWTVAHNLGYRPSGVLAQDGAGNDLMGDVTHVSVNQLTITYLTAVAGVADVS